MDGPKLDFDACLRWLEDRFGTVKKSGSNISVCAPWPSQDGRPDVKFHLSINPAKNVYRDWRPPNRSGTLVSLVAEMDNCSKREAAEKLGAVVARITADSFGEAIRSLSERSNMADKMSRAVGSSISTMPPGFTMFSDPTSIGDPQRPISLSYLEARGLPPEPFGLGYCRYAIQPREWPSLLGRIVIPYVGPSGSIMYWTARSVDGAVPKYFNLPTSKASQNIWCSDWSRGLGRIYITEGTFDSMVLELCGFRAIAIGGARASQDQLNLISMLAPREIVIATDSDGAGRSAMVEIAHKISASGFRTLVCSCPEGYKDWGEAWQDTRDVGMIREAALNSNLFGMRSEVETLLGARRIS